MKLEYLLNRLRRLSPEETLIKQQDEINTLASRLFTTYRQSLTTFENRYIRNLEKLELVNPLAIMKKGFSIVKKEDHLITSVNDVKLRDQINIEFVDGILTCEVNKIEKGEA
jgi:exodeoxyribonuclease VII large subunit